MLLEQKTLLFLLKMAINEDGSTLPKVECDWDMLASEARQHCVLLSIFGEISKLKKVIPEIVFERQTRCCYTHLAANTKVSIGQKQLVALLEQKGFPYTIIKGEAAAFFYPKPELRKLGDVDFLIDSKDEERITELLTETGFAVSRETDTRHRTFTKAGLRLEMHFKVAGIPDGVVGEKTNTFLESLLSDSRYVDSGMGKFKVPAERHHGLILLLHMQHHMLDGGIGLRHLCDWACFVAKTKDASFWNDELLPFLEEVGLLRYAIIMTKICAIYLGVHCPSWAVEADESVCEEIMEDILASGNFGRKDALRKGSGMLLPTHEAGKSGKNRFESILLIMRRSVLAKHPQARKNFLLFTLFFLYRSVRYAGMVLFDKRVPIFKSLNQADERKKLYDKLHIFDIE